MCEQNVQEVLCDKAKNGRERPWREKRVATEYTALAYDEVNERKALRLRDCGCYLDFKPMIDGGLKLMRANFCRVRLCPMCMWRRGLKVFAQTMAIMQELERERKCGYVLLTLTVRNCVGDELSATLDEMTEGWNRLTKYKRVGKAAKGWMRITEITHNLDNDTYHPHFHAILAVPLNYFAQGYISQADWTSMWQKAAGLDYKPIVHVKRVKVDTTKTMAKAVAEVAKYAVKDKDYIVPRDWELTVQTIGVLDAALHKRRLVAYGGKCREIHKRLHLDDAEDGDLVNVGDDSTPIEPGAEEISYSWSIGYQQYFRRVRKPEGV